ncbi:hypothetical protein A2U01_0116789, partial [Trifolium medium]|nr:hypothetical protein [Trifolium medium]
MNRIPDDPSLEPEKASKAMANLK